MSPTMLGGFPLDKAQIDVRVPAAAIGAYVLSRDGKTAHYVGRSDSDLANRLRTHAAISGYTTFWYELARSPMQAYFLECEWFHKFHPTANQNHPAVPPRVTWKCPVAGCPWGV